MDFDAAFFLDGQTFDNPSVSGVQSTVTFCETPRTDMQHFLQHHAMLSSRNQDDRVVFVYDCKAHNDKFSERYPTRPFFLLPPLDESHLAKCLNAAVPEDRDMFVILDGRRLEAANKFKKAINKSPKWKGTASFMVRLCYDNQEFGSGGFASTRMRSSIGALPEPIETVMVLAGKSVELECTDRKYLNLPGNSFTRSFSGIHLRSSEEHNVRIPKSVMAAVQKDLSVQGDGSAAGSGAKADAASTAFGSEPDSEGLAWFPWTCEEGVYLEMLNFWARAQQTVIVSMTAGYGQLELACVRTQTQCVALTLNATHRQAGADEKLSSHNMYLPIVARVRCCCSGSSWLLWCKRSEAPPISQDNGTWPCIQCKSPARPWPLRHLRARQLRPRQQRPQQRTCRKWTTVGRTQAMARVSRRRRVAPAEFLPWHSFSLKAAVQKFASDSGMPHEQAFKTFREHFGCGTSVAATEVYSDSIPTAELEFQHERSGAAEGSCLHVETIRQH